jgi:hypothetical protein
MNGLITWNEGRKPYSCQTSNIDASKERWNARSRFVNITQPFKACIRDRDSSFLGIYGSIRKISSFAEVLNITSQIFLARELEEWIPVSDRTLKNDDLPTFGRPNKGGVSVRKWSKEKNKPTMPILRLLLGRPRRVFLSTTAFFGGIFFFIKSERVVEKEEMR